VSGLPRFLARRLLLLVLVLWGMTVVTFVISHVVPGDPVRALAGPHASASEIATLRHQYGMDRPLPVQYLDYLGRLVHGDLGTSLVTRRPVLSDLVQFFPATVELTLTSLLLALVIGIPLGVTAATRAGSVWSDHGSRLISLVGVSMPVFWLGLLAQLIFYRQLNWLPSSGRLSLLATPPSGPTGFYLLDTALGGDWSSFGDTLSHLVLPAGTLALGSLAIVTRMTRTAMLETLGQDYVRTARAKGLPEWRVVYAHALKNALLPILTVIGLQVGYLLSGDFLTETVFSWPGIGLYAVSAITSLDFPAIMGVSLVVSLVYVLINLTVDFLYTVADPRVALSA
jgi:peptide/nickel transport system permease protein